MPESVELLVLFGAANHWLHWTGSLSSERSNTSPIPVSLSLSLPLLWRSNNPLGECPK